MRVLLEVVWWLGILVIGGGFVVSHVWIVPIGILISELAAYEMEIRK